MQQILLPTIFAILAYGFWISPDFKMISAGVAIFLFGMLALEEGFRAFTGGILERILQRTTDRLWKSLSFGIATTTIMQSSSLVSVIAISFLSAGLIGLAQGIGIIFGANLGTTTGAWLVAAFGLKVKISAYAMPMLVFGVILIFQKSKQLKGIGYVLAGLGFLFLGIHYMKEGFEAFKDTIDLAAYAVPGFTGLILFTMIGVAATVIMQSSHATLVLIITALAAGQISYENALALAIGANIGTTITAILGSLSSNEQGRRLAAAHLIFNLVTGMIAILFIHQLQLAVDSISSSVGIASDDYTLKLAVFHTLFNLIGIIVMVPFINRLVTLLERLIKADTLHFARPKYLNDSALEFSDTAIEALRLETLRIYDKATDIIARGLSLSNKQAIFSDEKIKLIVDRNNKPIEFDVEDAYDRYIKSLYSALLEFSNRLPPDAIAAPQMDHIRRANHMIMLTLKDVKHLQKNMVAYIDSGNPHIREEYNTLRRRIIKVMRRLDKIRNAPTPLTHEILHEMLQKNTSLLHGRMDELIRNSMISSNMAISLMNDSNYAYNIIRNLIKIHDLLIEQRAQKEPEADVESMDVAVN